MRSCFSLPGHGESELPALVSIKKPRKHGLRGRKKQKVYLAMRRRSTVPKPAKPATIMATEEGSGAGVRGV